ncbi:MAG: hypothetical protein IKB64_07000 [Paludibacteraceae bacterium]|nr:hypothetical protein [Paludibacteraceae bacterium]
MPYALDGSIDYYGRFNHVHPVPMTSGYEEKDTDPEHAKIRRAEKAQAELLSMLKLKCVYDIVPPEEITEETLTKSTVLLHDFTPSRAQKNPRRADMMTPILDSMAEIFPFMKTALISGCGTRGVVSQEGAEDSVKDASRAMHGAALNNEPFVAITSPMELQDLTNGSVYKVEEFALAMQTLDNFRLSLYGIDNGGLFEKKAHELQSEFDLKGSSVGLVMQDGLAQRQNFCNIVNSIWGDPSKPETLIWCMPADNIMGMDSEGDGTLFNNDTDSSQSGSEMPTEEGGNEND